MVRPIIGISAMNVFVDGRLDLVGVRPAYLRAIEAAGGVPMLIPLTDDLALTRALYERCDAILLPGGDDVDPAEFGEAPHPMLGEVDRQRDLVELALARWCYADAKPLLGICRGVQVLNVALGGTLYQDLPSQYTSELDHRASTHSGKASTIAHEVRFAPGSWLAETMAHAVLPANTLHHQAVRDVAPGLTVSGWAEDGVIEALERVDEQQWIVGLQCHPERLYSESEPRWQALFTAFVARATEAMRNVAH